MLKLALRNLLDKKIRFALTTLSVVTGVTFVVGTFALTDSLRSTFGDLAQDIAGETDLTVRAAQEIGNEADRPTMPDSLLDEVAAIDGVVEASGTVQARNVVIVDGEGNAIRPQGPPALGMNFSSRVFFLIEGEPPDGSGEFVVDATTATNNDLRVGETYDINGPVRSQPFELVGIFNFGSPDTNTSLGQTMSVFDTDTAQEFLGFGDRLVEIRVLVNADVAEVRAAIGATVGADYEVITQEIAAEEQTEQFQAVLNIFTSILLVFAFIAVFVSAFIINNTFQIVVTQRVREIGLWRAIGVTPKQVSRSIVVESAIVGLLSTAIGIAVGMLVSLVMRAAIRASGFGLPSGPLVLRPRTVALALVIGLGVTMIASIVPAMRARRITPIAALAHDYRIERSGWRRRVAVGGAVTAAGVVCLALGMAGVGSTAAVLALTGIGALVTFVGLNVASPAIARPVVRVLGRPIQALFGMPGRLARENAARNPRRTASTAGALMIGVTLMATTSVVGASVSSTIADVLSDAVRADYFVRSEASPFDPATGFPAQLLDDLEDRDEIESVVGYRVAFGGMVVDGDSRDVVTADFDTVERHMDGDVISGSITGGDPLTGIALHVDPAGDLGVAVGDTLEATFPDNETVTLTVTAIFADAAIYGNWLIDNALWEQHFGRRDYRFGTALAHTGHAESSQVALAEVVNRYPGVIGENRDEFREANQSLVNSIFAVITVLLGLSFVIALIGIANTLALSVFERTREIGLLRAVGMTRRQLRRAVRWEAAIVATFGGLMGVVVGTVLGVAGSLATPDSFITTVDVPYGTLAIYIVVAGLAGLLAAVLPARRAGRMHILDAIAHE
ncbi:ABC transporter permease [Candidatus Poriferisodalis sp.]|uniref:ABC transporter permease n=1 Tax=Candidatus Poriferisodalis sp. TaxID=3101277 RepID=UPI003B016C57